MAYMHTVINFLAAAILVGIIPVTYHLTGMIAMERESGMSQLIDCMMPNVARWQPQALRFLAAHLALDLVYGPAWVITGAILKIGAFSRTSMGITIATQVLMGLSLSSFSIFIASFFKRAQLSGISALILCLLLGVITQFTTTTRDGAVIILSLFFPPMNYVYLIIFMARWESQNQPTDLVRAAPDSPWTVPGMVFWLFLIVQILLYPILGSLVDHLQDGTVFRGYLTTREDNSSSSAVSLRRLTKLYETNHLYGIVCWFFGIRRRKVLAVDGLSLDIPKGQVTMLLGENGSGKSTTLDAISGLIAVTDGRIILDYGRDGRTFGLCPQKNVLWDSLTVKEHVTIFNKLKTVVGTESGDHHVSKLMEDCDLETKADAYAGSLSGGQRRRLQLAMMFAGDSSICCVDEVSSGLDPISRRKIWNTILAHRGTCTIMLTTHYLDEADMFADHVIILSKGVLKAQGSSIELKHQLGSGYQMHVHEYPGSGKVDDLKIGSISKQTGLDGIIYRVKDSTEAAQLVTTLERRGITKYRVRGPTIEDAFLKATEHADSTTTDNLGLQECHYNKCSTGGPYFASDKDKMDKHACTNVGKNQTLQLETGRPVGIIRQASVMFIKRTMILRRNVLPHLAALAIPVIAAGLVTMFLGGISESQCSQSLSLSDPSILLGAAIPNKESLRSSNRISINTLQPDSNHSSYRSSTNRRHERMQVVDSYEELRHYINQNTSRISPGLLYLGNTSIPPTFAWKADKGNMAFPAMVHNSLNKILTNVPINFEFQVFDVPQLPNVSSILQFVSYFNLAMTVYPALFTLYPTSEKLSGVRALHYSSGVRSLALWLAYLAFDFCISLVASIIIIVIFRYASAIWYELGYLFVVFLLYGVCSTLLAYIVSRFARSKLAAFAISAGLQSVMYLIYLVAYVAALTYSSTSQIDYYINVAHFTIALVSPIGSLTRSMFITLNAFSILCRGTEVASQPGEMTIYGGPILYLALQSLLLLFVLIWLDRGVGIYSLRNRSTSTARAGVAKEDEECAYRKVAKSCGRRISADDGLHVLHLTKVFGKNRAVDDVSFDVAREEVFALLGPNGAGKTTTIALIQGQMELSREAGDVFVDTISMRNHRAAARRRLGVCPQYDALDDMTVLEHLWLYACIRGVPNVEHNVSEVLRAVGLNEFDQRMAKQLSGGNKRKLSLGIALIGNQPALVLDEPSAGMDATAKRVMWKTLRSVQSDKSILLTTHSMEEADALANRAGIIAGRMLAIGTTEHLCHKYGNMYHVHLEHWQGPHTSDSDVENMRQWISTMFPGAVIEQQNNNIHHGQIRFSVPATMMRSDNSHMENMASSSAAGVQIGEEWQTGVEDDRTGMRADELFSCLERMKSMVGVRYYSVNQDTLDQVFLRIVGECGRE